MDFEKNVPEWNAPGTEPPETLKDEGFQAGYKPPAAFFNWFWHSISEAVKEIRAKLAGHAEATGNVHGMSKADIGLGNVENTADSDKSVAYADEAGEAQGLQKKITVQLNGGATEGTDKFTFNGTADKSINVTPEKIGAANKDMSNVTDKAAARNNLGITPENIGALSTGGGNSTGQLTAPTLAAKAAYPQFLLYNANGQTIGSMEMDTYNNANTLYFSQKAASESYRECFALPARTAGLTANKYWEFLTSKNPVTVSQGGTGATDAATARTNLGITPANIGAAASSHSHAASAINSGTLDSARLPTVPLTKGGTGATTAAQARTNLEITPANIGAATASHNHAATNITSGTLASDRLPTVPINKGGTNATDAATARTNLGITPANIGAAASSHNHAASAINSGTLDSARLPTVPLTKGGTGATDAATARTNLGITPANIGAAASSHNHAASNITSGTLSADRLPTVPLTKGGTGATTAAAARTNLGAVNIAGDTMTGNLSTPNFVVKGDGYRGLHWKGADGAARATILTTGSDENRLTLDVYAPGCDKAERYLLPKPETQTAEKWFSILTSKYAVSVAQGGTGATTSAAARTNLGAVNKAGDTMTGELRATRLGAYGSNDYPTVAFKRKSDNQESAMVQSGTNGRVGVYSYHSDQVDADTHYYEGYTFPTPSAGATANKTYPILTGKTGAFSFTHPTASWKEARDKSLIYNNAGSDGYAPLWASKTSVGVWAMGTYQKNLVISYTTDADYSAGNNNSKTITLSPDGHITGLEPAWKYLTPTNGTTPGSVGSGKLRYKKIGDHVFVAGSVNIAVPSNASIVIATLPTGYRPAKNTYQLTAGGGRVIARIFVSTAGELKCEWVRSIGDDAAQTDSNWLECTIDFWTTE